MSDSIGFKEWEAVCEALGSGAQCLLLRKGGIHEGRDGFSFKHARFFLFPTRFHEQSARVRISCDVPSGEWEAGDEVPVRYFCEALWARTCTDWERVRQLEPFHVWNEEVVRQRFGWGEDDRIHCALVRVHRLAEPRMLAYGKQYAGCRTWINLPEAPAGVLQSAAPVLSDREFEARRREIEAVLK